MKCSGETNLEGLRHPSKYRAVPNEREELFILGWEIVQPEVDRLTELGWAADKKGNRHVALKHYRGANIYFYMIHLGIIVRNYIQSLGTLDQKCNSAAAEEKYCLKCVEHNLMCLGKTYMTDYQDAWDRLLEAFGVDRQTDNCTDCCVGISEMIIDHPDDCIAFIIGGCDENEEPEPPYGEFEPCEFEIQGFTQPVGPNIYDNCDN